MRLFLLVVMAAGCLRCGHVQPPVERRAYVISEGAQGVGGSGEDSCHQEHVRCFDTCWNTVPPYPHKKGDGWHHEYLYPDMPGSLHGVRQGAGRSGEGQVTQTPGVLKH